MRRNPERTAWIVLILSFITFCTLAVSIPLGVRAYVYNTSTIFTTTLTSIRGTVLAKTANDETPIPLTHGTAREIDELTIVSTDDTSQAVLTFFDGSIVTLYNNTTLVLHRAREPRFSISPYPAELGVEVVQGRIRASVTPNNGIHLFWIRTPHAKAILSQGSFAVESRNDQTQITARAGDAQVTAQQQTVVITEGELTTIALHQPPTAPTTAEQNLIVNGDFSQGLYASWVPTVYVPADPMTGTLKALAIKGDDFISKVDTVNAVTSTLKLVTAGRKAIVQFTSNGTDNVHTEASIEQEINKDVQDFRSLRINAQIRLNYQSLPGGGQLGTEFPIMLQLNYRDLDGNDRTWYRGFYYQPAPSNYILHNEADNNNESIAQFLWYPYESENLLDRLGVDKPAFIKSIRLYASGWIYDSMITDIKLLAED